MLALLWVSSTIIVGLDASEYVITEGPCEFDRDTRPCCDRLSVGSQEYVAGHDSIIPRKGEPRHGSRGQQTRKGRWSLFRWATTIDCDTDMAFSISVWPFNLA